VSDVPVPFSRVRDGLRVAVKVTPKASRNRIGGAVADADGGGVFRISVTAPPDRGRANHAVIRLLAKAWAVPKTSITVASGATSRRKSLLVAGDPAELDTRVRDWLARCDG
jgi:uncharacterized protein